MQKSESSYWNSYYGAGGAPALPSQFAVFAVNEYWPSSVLDIGCGSGRDSFWFAQEGIQTVGVDGSETAVAMCSKYIGKAKNIQFICADIQEKGLADRLSELVDGAPLLYARFFLHAIDEEGQTSFLRLAASILHDRGGVLAVEYRTPRDKALTKSTAEHYRRFVNPTDLTAEAASFNLGCRYSVEGFGFAKYKQDDAYVCRMLFDPAPR